MEKPPLMENQHKIDTLEEKLKNVLPFIICSVSGALIGCSRANQHPIEPQILETLTLYAPPLLFGAIDHMKQMKYLKKHKPELQNYDQSPLGAKLIMNTIGITILTIPLGVATFTGYLLGTYMGNNP